MVFSSFPQPELFLNTFSYNNSSLFIYRVWKSKAPIFEVCAKMIVHLSLNDKNGKTLSLPIYGATVTASHDKASKNVLAYALLVFPISPRLASAITKCLG